MDVGEKRLAQQQDTNEGEKLSTEPPATTVGATTVSESQDNPGDKVPSQKRVRPNEDEAASNAPTAEQPDAKEDTSKEDAHPATDKTQEPQAHEKFENKSAEHTIKSSSPPKPYEPYGPPSSMRMSTAVAYKTRSSVPPPEMVTGDSAAKKSEPAEPARSDSITREDLLKAFAAPAENTVTGTNEPAHADADKTQASTSSNPSSKTNAPEFQNRKVSVASSDITPTTDDTKETTAGTQQRKSISLPMATDASILGNAIAKAMVASATAARSNSGNPATAAVIGNLAANINTLLQNGEKKGESGQIMSNSSISQMLDQAIRLGARSTENGNQNSGTTRTAKAKGKMPNKTSTDATPDYAENSEKPAAEETKPRLIVKNDAVWEDLKRYKERRLGTRLYMPRMTLPNFEGQYNCLLDVLVPARYLSYDNEMVKKKTIWGTDIYTDDSDVVAMILHSGKYHLEFQEPELDPNDPLFKAIGAEVQEDNSSNERKATTQEPDHDVRVTLRLMPPLRSYKGCIRHHIKSRSFGPHSGCSLHVESVEKIKKGDARLTSRMAKKAFLRTVMCDPAWLNRSRR